MKWWKKLLGMFFIAVVMGYIIAVLVVKYYG